MIDFTLRRTTTTAPIDEVFDRLTDHAAYREMTMLRTSRLERPGDTERNGVGAIRRMGLIGPTQTEEVTEFVRPTRFAYALRSGLPVRDHIGEVDLVATVDGGTAVTYHVRSQPTLPIPGAEFVLGLVLKQGIGDLLRGVIAAAERSAQP